MAIQRRGRGAQAAPTSKTNQPAQLQTTPSSLPSRSSSSSLRSKESSAASPFSLNDDPSAGLVLSVHPVWPDFQLVQGELFFECTLFLYSVLALAVQYLNLYKSLWWLPKSYWHYTMKLHHINPYFLSCVGLLLGLRVTKCFWNTITELITSCSEGMSERTQKFLKLIEYSIIKLPVTTMILTSFFFSFTRIIREFPTSSVMYFFFPPLLYAFLFWDTIMHRMSRFRVVSAMFFNRKASWKEALDTLSEDDPRLLDIDSVVHMCSSSPSRIRMEVNMLIEDLSLRLRRCFFAGCTTAFLSIALPLFFVPYKTSLGMPQQLLIFEVWEVQKTLVVFGTAFTHYVTYLFPLPYIDLLYRSAMHLGQWEFIGMELPPSTASIGPAPAVSSSTPSVAAQQRRMVPTTEIVLTTWSPSAPLYPENTMVRMPDGRRFRSVAISSKVRTVAAEPGNPAQSWFAYFCAHPLALINLMCCFELALIFAQFWLLILTTEWQHIVTLVLLMCANYLLLGKLFKDRVIVSRVYEPSKEDQLLMEQVQAETARKREANYAAAMMQRS